MIVDNKRNLKNLTLKWSSIRVAISLDPARTNKWDSEKPAHMHYAS